MNSRNGILRVGEPEKQYLRYRSWALLCFWVGVTPFACFTVLSLVGRLDQAPPGMLFIGAMVTALGLFAAACLYFDGVVPLRREPKCPPM